LKAGDINKVIIDALALKNSVAGIAADCDSPEGVYDAVIEEIVKYVNVTDPADCVSTTEAAYPLVISLINDVKS